MYPDCASNTVDDSSELVRTRTRTSRLRRSLNNFMPSSPGMKYGVIISNSDCTAAAASATGWCISWPTISPFSTRFFSGVS